jgi:hypothetical protein
MCAVIAESKIMKSKLDYASGPVIMGSSSDSAGATGNNKAAL